jgi:hypothetical protein
VTATAHAAAVMNLLYAIGPPLTVFPKANGGATTVPNGQAPPYVTVHITVDRPTDERLNMASARMRLRIYCHCSGANDTAALAVSDMVAGALLDARPVVVGRVAYPIRFSVDQPPRPDESTGTTVSTLTDVYTWQTDPGTP